MRPRQTVLRAIQNFTLTIESDASFSEHVKVGDYFECGLKDSLFFLTHGVAILDPEETARRHAAGPALPLCSAS